MDKKLSGVSQTMSRFRGWIQAGATLLTNLHLPNFLKGRAKSTAGNFFIAPKALATDFKTWLSLRESWRGSA